jgi:hypothetical protein
VSGENVSAITPHTLRRTFGSHLLNRGLRLEVVRRLLGHSSTVVTERAYAELLAPTIRDELLAVLNGRALVHRLSSSRRRQEAPLSPAARAWIDVKRYPRRWLELGVEPAFCRIELLLYLLSYGGAGSV